MKMTRDEFVENMNKKLDVWNDEIADLEERIDEAQDMVSANAETQLIEIRAKFREARERLGRVADTAIPAWERLRGETAKSMDALDSAIHKARARFIATKPGWITEEGIVTECADGVLPWRTYAIIPQE